MNADLILIRIHITDCQIHHYDADPTATMSVIQRYFREQELTILLKELIFNVNLKAASLLW